jgi:hypothetical protein
MFLMKRLCNFVALYQTTSGRTIASITKIRSLSKGQPQGIAPTDVYIFPIKTRRGNPRGYPLQTSFFSLSIV